MINKKTAHGRDSCQKRQKSGASLKPSLVPKHDSVLLDRLQQILVFLWIFVVVLLGMGGIVREKAIGTSSLSLALPVRARLMGVRVAMGVIGSRSWQKKAIRKWRC
jgi:hypothetical protein